MKYKLIFLTLILIVSYSYAQYPPLSWAKKIEAVDQNNAQCAISVNEVDEQGAIYCSGYFRDTLRPDQNQLTNYLVGNSNWDSGAFMKYDANGNLIWAKAILARVGYFYVSDLAIDQQHNVYVLCQGVYTDTIDFDPSPSTAYEISDGNDFFIAKYDANGNYLWSKLLNVVNGNSTFSNSPNTITVDNSQNIFIGGRFQNQIDLDPSAATLTVSNPGGVNCNCTVGFYAKYDSNGNVIWGFADINNSSVTEIDINELNDQIVIGGQPGTNSQPLKLCNANGTLINSLNGGSIYTKSVKFDTLGNIYFSGYFHNTVDFDWSNASFTLTTPASYELAGFVGKYDSQGNFQWAAEYDPTLDPNFDANYYNITIDTDNNPIVAYGETNGNGYRKGFFKINAGNGVALWPNSMFDVLVGLNGVDAIPSPFDGSIVFGAGAGFSSNAITTFDAAPDPNVVSNITGTGYWSFMAKYGNCVAPPSTPGAVSGTTSLCNTDSLSYSIPLQNGVSSYTWTLPSGWTGTSITNTITLQPNNSGGSIEVVANNLCGVSAASSLQVNYVGAPNVIASASTTQVCMGDSVVLNGAGADTYVWDNNVLNGQAFVPASTQNYTLVGTVNGCINSDTIAITVNPLPIVTLNLNAIDTLCQDAGVITLVGESPVGGVFSGTGVSANTFDALTTGMGTYTITYTFSDANACVNTAEDSIYVDVCTGYHLTISDAQQFVYPNPFYEQATLIIHSDIDEKVQLEVFDILGNVVWKQNVSTNTNVCVGLELAQGTYMVKAISASGSNSNFRVIKVN